MKDEAEVVREFHELVNMTASDLESWLKSGDSRSAGWPKSDGKGDGETVGHDSGRKIVDILKANPKQDSDSYTDEQVAHMRKVVAYCKRHLAQESAGNEQKSAEELQETKSYASLKNWGHDFLKARGELDSESNDVASPKKKGQNGKTQAAKGHRGAAKHDRSEEDGKGEGDDEEDENDAEVDAGGEDEDEDEDEDAEEEEDQSEGEDDAEEKKSTKQVGKKRKQASGADGSSKRRETRKGAATRSTKQSADKNGDDDDGDDDDEESEEDEDDKSGQGKKPKKGPSKGDTVSWNWGSGQPEGKVLDVRGETTTITTKRGNEVSRNGKPEDPAVVLDAGSSKAIKLAHELN